MLPHTVYRDGAVEDNLGRSSRMLPADARTGISGFPLYFYLAPAVSFLRIFFFAFLTNNKKKGANDNKHNILLSENSLSLVGVASGY